MRNSLVLAKKRHNRKQRFSDLSEWLSSLDARLDSQLLTIIKKLDSILLLDSHPLDSQGYTQHKIDGGETKAAKLTRISEDALSYYNAFSASEGSECESVTPRKVDEPRGSPETLYARSLVSPSFGELSAFGSNRPGALMRHSIQRGTINSVSCNVSHPGDEDTVETLDDGEVTSPHRLQRGIKAESRNGREAAPIPGDSDDVDEGLEDKEVLGGLSATDATAGSARPRRLLDSLTSNDKALADVSEEELSSEMPRSESKASPTGVETPWGASRHSNSSNPRQSAANWRSSLINLAPTKIAKTLTRSKTRDEKVFRMAVFKERIATSRRNRIVHAIWQFLDEPESSLWARCYCQVMQCIILASALISLLQTAPGYFFEGVVAAVIDTTIDFVFALEVLFRWGASPHRFLFATDAFNLVDLLEASALFFRVYIGFVVSATDTDDPIEMYLLYVVPILRVLKILRRFELFNLLLSAFKIAFEAIPVLMFTFSTILFGFSSVLYIVEPRDNVTSFPQAMWLTIITMTTVGYGDLTPESTPGHIIVSVLAVVSAMYMAIPLGIVGNAFNTVWEDRDRLLLVQRARNRLVQRGYKAEDIPTFFQVYATCHEDEFHEAEVSLDVQDFSRMIHEMQIGLSEDRIVQLFQLFDADGGGTVEPEEFVRVLFPKAHYLLYTVKKVGETQNEMGKQTSLRSGLNSIRSESTDDFCVDRNSVGTEATQQSVLC